MSSRALVVDLSQTQYVFYLLEREHKIRSNITCKEVDLIHHFIDVSRWKIFFEILKTNDL